MAESIIFTFILWILLSITVSYGARNRRRDGTGWFFLALLLSPVLAGFMLIVLGEPLSKQPDRDGGRLRITG